MFICFKVFVCSVLVYPTHLGKGRAHVGKIDAILTDSYLDTRVKRCILMNAMILKLEYV